MFTQLLQLLLAQLLNSGILFPSRAKTPFGVGPACRAGPWREGPTRQVGPTSQRRFGARRSAKTPLENPVIYGENESRVRRTQENLGKHPYVSSGKTSPIRENAFQSRSRLPGGTLSRGFHSASGTCFASAMTDAHSVKGKIGESGKTQKKVRSKNPVIYGENEICVSSTSENHGKQPYRCFGKTPRSRENPRENEPFSTRPFRSFMPLRFAAFRPETSGYSPPLRPRAGGGPRRSPRRCGA